jgi:hypothetical protein
MCTDICCLGNSFPHFNILKLLALFFVVVFVFFPCALYSEEKATLSVVKEDTQTVNLHFMLA